MKFISLLLILGVGLSTGGRPKRSVITDTAARLLLAGSGWGWGWTTTEKSPSAVDTVQKLLLTKARLIPFTGQVAGGVAGIATVKRDLLGQLTVVGARAVSKAAAGYLARAAAAELKRAKAEALKHTHFPADLAGWSSLVQPVAYKAPAAIPVSYLGYPGGLDLTSAYSNPAQVVSQVESPFGEDPSLLSSVLSALPASRLAYDAVFSENGQAL